MATYIKFLAPELTLVRRGTGKLDKRVLDTDPQILNYTTLQGNFDYNEYTFESEQVLIKKPAEVKKQRSETQFTHANLKRLNNQESIQDKAFLDSLTNDAALFMFCY